MPAVAWRDLNRWRVLLPALWAGLLIAVATLATPAPFALLDRADAGRVAARVLSQEARASLGLGALLLVLEWRLHRRGAAAAGPGAGMLLTLGALFCTVFGYFALQPLMDLARAGQGPLGFAQLHAASVSFFAIKLALVLALAWRAAAPTASLSPGRTSS